MRLSQTRFRSPDVRRASDLGLMHWGLVAEVIGGPIATSGVGSVSYSEGSYYSGPVGRHPGG